MNAEQPPPLSPIRNQTAKTTKANYIRRIRSESAYPVFRGLARCLAVLLYIIAALMIVGSVIAAFQTERALVYMGSFVLGFACIVLGRLFEEISSMIADIADSVTDYNCRVTTVAAKPPPPEEPLPPPL